MIISQHRTPMAWLKSLALLVASLLCGLLLIESALRLMGWSFPVFMHPDVDLGWSHPTGIVGWRRWRAERHYKREPRSGCGRGLESLGDSTR